MKTLFPTFQLPLSLVLLLLMTAATWSTTAIDAYSVGETLARLKQRQKLKLRHPRQLIKEWVGDVKVGYRQRVAADPSFALKSCAEVALAAGTQFAAEYRRRGAARMLPEIDFVFPAILAAIFGKYYSMWKVAKTADASAPPAAASSTIGSSGGSGSGEGDDSGLVSPSSDSSGDNGDDGAAAAVKDATASKGGSGTGDPMLGSMPVPSNAFQPYMLDGVTVPTMRQRFGSIVAPMLPLFKAGFAASAVGYGVAALLVALRTAVIPSYVPQTQTVNVLHAAVFTGAFLAIVSNLRYQVLQGVVEPAIDRTLNRVPIVRSGLVFAFRLANGYLGSNLSILGMRYFGMQKLKQ